MRSEGLLRHLAICAAVAVVFYFASFHWIEGCRAAKGPWEITFRTDAAGTPALLVVQTNLKVSQTVVFPGRAIQPANVSRTIRFTQPPAQLPFGQLLFLDPTFLPGTVTLRLFGHDIQFLPRVLLIDQNEYPWRAGTEIQLH